MAMELLVRDEKKPWLGAYVNSHKIDEYLRIDLGNMTLTQPTNKSTNIVLATGSYYPIGMIELASGGSAETIPATACRRFELQGNDAVAVGDKVKVTMIASETTPVTGGHAYAFGIVTGAGTIQFTVCDGSSIGIAADTNIKFMFEVYKSI